MLLPCTVRAPGVGFRESGHKVNGHAGRETQDLFFSHKSDH